MKLLCCLLLVPLVAVHALTDLEKALFGINRPRPDACENWVTLDVDSGRRGDVVVIKSNGVPRELPDAGGWQEVRPLIHY